MSDFCSYKEMIKQLENAKAQMQVWGHDFDIFQLIFSLKNHIKDVFPMNEVPSEVVNGLNITFKSFQLAWDSLETTLDITIQEVEKLLKKHHPDD